MKVNIYKSNWWDRAYFIYRLRPSVLLYVNGKFHRIASFKGKKVNVHMAGKVSTFSLWEARRYRLLAILERMTLCNNTIVYGFDFKSDSCQNCYLYPYCNSAYNTTVKQKRRKYIMDMVLVSKFLADNKDFYEPSQT